MVRTKTKHKRNINNSKRRKGLVGSCVILDQIKPIMENIQSRGLKRPGGPAEEWNTLLPHAKKYYDAVNSEVDIFLKAFDQNPTKNTME